MIARDRRWSLRYVNYVRQKRMKYRKIRFKFLGKLFDILNSIPKTVLFVLYDTVTFSTTVCINYT